MLQLRSRCMGLKRFWLQNVGNFRCVWIEPNEMQPNDQILIIRKQLIDGNTKSIRWCLLNTSFSINYSNIMSDNHCRKAKLRQSVPEANSPTNFHNWNLPQNGMLMERQTWCLTIECTFRSSYQLLILKPPSGAWLIWRASLTSWGERLIASPWMSRSSSRRNCLLT